MPEAFLSARPTVIVKGTFDSELNGNLVRLTVEENSSGYLRCEAAFVNWGLRTARKPNYLYNDRQLLDFGLDFTINFVPDTATTALFDGQIIGLRGQFVADRLPEIVVLAESGLQALRGTRRTRTFDDISLADVIKEIASEHDLDAVVKLDGPTYAILSQVNQSDWAFLHERAAAAGVGMWVGGKTLHAILWSDHRPETVQLDFGQKLLSFSPEANISDQYTSVSVSGWDPADKRTLQASVNNRAIAGELDGKQSGSSVLSRAFGARPQHLARENPGSIDEARELALASFRSLARRFVSGCGLARGDVRIRVGGKVNIGGVGSLFNGEYFAAAVRHTFDTANGFQTYFEVRRAGVGLPRKRKKNGKKSNNGIKRKRSNNAKSKERKTPIR